MHDTIVIYLLAILPPLIVSNALHMLAVKYDWLPFLKRTINIKVFGKNKTWRGFIVLPLFNGILTMLAYHFFFSVQLSFQSFLFGYILGLVYMLSELPNSYFKRRQGIEPGESGGFLFKLLDKSDSSFGVALATVWFFNCKWLMFPIFLFINIAAHGLFSYLLYKLKIKKLF